MDELKDFRNQIDEIDALIAKLLSERFALAAKIAEYKKERGLDILQKDRENEVLNNISGRVDNEEYREYVLKIYKEILEASKDLQRKLM